MKLKLPKNRKILNLPSKVLKILLVFFSLTCTFSLLGTSEAAKHDVYSFIKSADVKQFDEVIKGFRDSFPEAKVKVINLERKRNSKLVASFISKNKPSVIICLGAGAAITTAAVEKKIPIIFSMVLNYKRYKQLTQRNVTGVAMEILPMTLFTQFRLLYPKLKSIAIPYHPDASTEIVQDAIKASKFLSLKIIPLKVSNPEEMDDILSDAKSRFNGLWMIADFKLYNKRTNAFKTLIDFSIDNKKPLLAFSEPFIKAGSFFSVSTDNNSLGSQIALISKQIVLDKTPPGSIPVAPPIGTFTVINKNVAMEIMEEDFDDSIIYQVDKVYPTEEDED